MGFMNATSSASPNKCHITRSPYTGLLVHSAAPPLPKNKYLFLGSWRSPFLAGEEGGTALAVTDEVAAKAHARKQ